MNDEKPMIEKRDYATAEYFPDPMTAEEFITEITNKKSNDAFVENMKNIKHIPEKQFVEKWAQLYIAWKEMNEYSN